jgi:hypothetical protein
LDTPKLLVEVIDCHNLQSQPGLQNRAGVVVRTQSGTQAKGCGSPAPSHFAEYDGINLEEHGLAIALKVNAEIGPRRRPACALSLRIALSAGRGNAGEPGFENRARREVKA